MAGGGTDAQKRGAHAELPLKMRERMLEFKAHLQLELGAAKNTVLSYMSDIALFGEFLVREKGAESFEEADEDCAVVWLGEQSNLGAASQARRLSALKSFASHMCDAGIWPKNYASAAVRPKFRRGVPQTLTPLEIGALIESAEGDSFERLRDAAMLELMYGSGLRVSEICSLKAADVDLNEGVLRVRGKGSKTRLVPIGRMSAKAIEAYLNELKKMEANRAPELFITRRLKKLSRKTFWYNLKKYAARAGIKKPVKPHGLRHSFATHLLQNGANLMSISEMLGHADLSTTQIYTQLLTEDLTRQHSAKHPRSKMNIDTSDV